MPVIFLPNDGNDNEECDDTGDTNMSSFGFMSFAMAVVNAVINNANNVNNNNNNNNNNDNNNNNNIGNINIANSNNDVNNMNMVTAGRRRMLLKNKNVKLFGNTNTHSNLPQFWLNNITRAYPSTDSNITSNDNETIKTISIGYIHPNNSSNHHAIYKGSYLNMNENVMEVFDSLSKRLHTSKTNIDKFVDRLFINFISSNHSFQKLGTKLKSVIEIGSKIKSFVMENIMKFFKSMSS